ncbi:MAG TPA: hypothetical protein VFS20_27685 [Longimicrobium sp.]|nr:hypothetical protein [Longimicrobium sp.]
MPYTGPRTDARGLDSRLRGAADPRAAAAQQLVGLMFTTAKELRHIAEQHFVEEFIPTRTVEETAQRTVITLRTESLGTLTVYAERERRWYPFHVIRVDVARPEPRNGNGRSDGRPRLPHGYRISSRPRIDWL